MLSLKTQQIPTPISGLALAIASIGLSWDAHIGANGQISLLCACLAALLLAPVVLKFFLNPSLLIAELKNPVAGAMLPVITMAMMVINKSVASFNLNLAITLNVIALSLQLVMAISFIYYRSQDFQFAQMIPCWFIPPIGFVLIVLVSPVALPLLLTKAILYGATIAYAFLLPLVLYRLKSLPMPAPQRPIIAILATPASLILAGLIASNLPLNLAFVLILSVVAVVMTIGVYIATPKLLSLDFSPVFAAFTFPLVVSSTALFSLHSYLSNLYPKHTLVTLLHGAAILELAIASCVLAYVAWLYVKHFFAANK